MRRAINRELPVELIPVIKSGQVSVQFFCEHTKPMSSRLENRLLHFKDRALRYVVTRGWARFSRIKGVGRKTLNELKALFDDCEITWPEHETKVYAESLQPARKVMVHQVVTRMENFVSELKEAS